MKAILPTLLLLVAVLIVSGCTGSGPSTGAGTGNNQSGTGATGGTGLAGIFSAAQPTEWLIEYDMSVTSGGETQSFSERMAVKGTNKYKMEMSGTSDNKQYFVDYFKIDANAYYCVKSDSQWMCMQIAQGEVNQSDYETNDQTAKQYKSDPAMLYKGTRVVAGRTTQCYSFTHEQNTWEWCYDPSTAMLLYGSWSGPESSGTMTATEFSTSVPDSEFTLPATPTQIPGY